MLGGDGWVGPPAVGSPTTAGGVVGTPVPQRRPPRGPEEVSRLRATAPWWERPPCGAERSPALGLGARALPVPTALCRCLAEAAYERTLTVDGEETTLLVMDAWEPEQRVRPGWAPRGAASGAGWAATRPGAAVRAQPLLRGLRAPWGSLWLSWPCPGLALAAERGRTPGEAGAGVWLFARRPLAWEAARRLLTGRGGLVARHWEQRRGHRGRRSVVPARFGMRGNGLGLEEPPGQTRVRRCRQPGLRFSR